jgi:ATP-binding cassette subfamily B protein/subfamily B ATP-binding cassette protein MsbA
MRNFIRVLKLSLTYRRRLIVSALCAVAVAISWSVNLSAIFPVLKILGSGDNLQSWVNKEITLLDDQLNDKQMATKLDSLEAEIERTKAWPDSAKKDDLLRKLTSEQSKLHGKKSDLATLKYRYELLQTKVIRYLPHDKFETFCWIVVGVIFSVAVKGVFEFFQESLVGWVVCRTQFDLRNQFFRATIHQDTKQLAETGSADILAHFGNDTEQIATGLKMLFGRVILEPLKIVGCIAAAMVISWQLTVMFALIVPVALFSLTYVAKKMKKASKRVLEQMSGIIQVLRESLDGIRVLKAFTREANARHRFRTITADYFRRSMRVINLDAFAGPLMELLGIAAVGLALTAGAYLVIRGQTDLLGIRMANQQLGFESLISLYMLLAAIADPVRKLSSVFSKIQTGMAACDRIYHVMDRTATVGRNADGPAVPRHNKSIEFKHVCFAYVPGKDTLLDIDLTVKAGETVAIVGPNGSGKSTLIGLLTRFFDPDFGSVSIDGVTLRHANLRSLRRQLGIVTQDTMLFDESVRANIAYGLPGATREQIESAAQQAFAHEFILELPQGYDTIVGERGNNLSGGQRQRIALARAFLRDPRILILDEFTSAVDAESDWRIHLALKQFKKGRTTFLITHRMKSVDIADRIVVMDAGRIVAVGQHDQLILTCPVYRRLCESQSGSWHGEESLRPAA